MPSSPYLQTSKQFTRIFQLLEMATKTPGLDEKQVSKAVTALLKFAGKQKAEKKELFEEDDLLYLVRLAACMSRFFSQWPFFVPPCPCANF